MHIIQPSPSAKGCHMPTFFASEFEFRRWLEANHETAPELLVGFWKKSTGKPSIDWPQARDQALCFGWIDGIRKSLGDDAYTIRFTPRREGSIWSKVNVERYEALFGTRAYLPAAVAKSIVAPAHAARESARPTRRRPVAPEPRQLSLTV